MSNTQLYKKNIYVNKKSNSILFFINPFGIKTWKLKPVIVRLQQAGYTLVAYETHDDIFNAADPTLLPRVIDDIEEDIKLEIRARKQRGASNFGIFGSSLGGFIAFNCISQIPELRWGVFNTGGNVAEAMWRFDKQRKLHELKGISKDKLIKAWYKVQHPDFPDLTGNSYLFLSGPGDNIAPISEITPYVELVKQAGALVEVVSVDAKGHGKTALKGFLQAKKLIDRVQAKLS